MSALKELVNIHTGIYEYQKNGASWFKSNFNENVWTLIFGKNDTKIAWDQVELNDGTKLTNPKNAKILNTFKHWVLACGDPLVHGGKLVTFKYTERKIQEVITIINGILLHSSYIDLAKNQFALANFDFFISLLRKMMLSGSTEGIYSHVENVRDYLIRNIEKVSDREIESFKAKYPYLSVELIDSEKVLNLTNEQRIKACFWLEGIGYYRKVNRFWAKGNGSVLKEVIYKNRIIPRKIYLPTFPELWLQEEVLKTEYKPISYRNDSDDSDCMKPATLSQYLVTLRFLYYVAEKSDVVEINTNELQKVDLKAVYDSSLYISKGRMRTQDPEFVLCVMRSCFEFIIEHHDSILKSLFKVIKEFKSYKKLNPKKQYEWLERVGQSFIEDDLITLGVKTTSKIEKGTVDKFIKLRSNESLGELYTILVGNICILIGATVARRGGEIESLKPFGNLVPDESPFENPDQEYCLRFNVEKSGISLGKSHNKVEDRPILHKLAGFIWKLEQFNKSLIDNGISKEKEIGLVNSFSHNHLPMFIKLDKGRMSDSLDTVCDYFETPVYELSPGRFFRNYIRSHQLRRFFVMCFFWSVNDKDGMDTLRWMLGHTDLEHLYHYISESDTGGVLKGVKANYIVKGLLDSTNEIADLEHIDELERLIVNRYSLNEHGTISVLAIQEAIETFDYQHYKTNPSIEQIKFVSELEDCVGTLIEGGVISLEPEFFTAKVNGDTKVDFHLALKIMK
ncbi:MAG: hypothetical protein CL584_06755 [Alteromonadaceae bacterium]|nr:hypothetical protein [Alteromonadaceae bacterium]|tara:strand:- start:2070 stop:4280 length:2211 start_codon:yes stop_codon:yes gene_type:complete